MIVIDGVDNYRSQSCDLQDKNTFVRKLLDKMYSALPECDFEQRHFADSCIRCSAHSVIDMIALGFIEKKADKKALFNKKIYRFFKKGIILGFAIFVAYKIFNKLNKSGFFTQDRIDKWVEFIKKHPLFK